MQKKYEKEMECAIQMSLSLEEEKKRLLAQEEQELMVQIIILLFWGLKINHSQYFFVLFQLFVNL